VSVGALLVVASGVGVVGVRPFVFVLPFAGRFVELLFEFVVVVESPQADKKNTAIIPVINK
jgi:hypothetical protein